MKRKVDRSPSTLLVAGILALLSVAPLASHEANDAAQTSIAEASPGACSTVLPDGRSFVSGGIGESGALAASGFFDRTGKIVPASPMTHPRSNHVCVTLKDGSVLVAGGDSGDERGVAHVEIFDVAANKWRPANSMQISRRNAHAVALPDGTALVLGGEIPGKATEVAEVYDPSHSGFRQAAGVFSSQRVGFAVAVLGDGRVIVAGGRERETILDSIDVFDPVQGLYHVGRMTAPRINFTATALTDGRVLFAGGTDGVRELASVDIYDSATGVVSSAGALREARKNHVALRSPGNDHILIYGGTGSDGPAANTEIFSPSTNVFDVIAESPTQDDSVPYIMVGSLAPDGTTVGATKVYRIPTR